MPASFLDPSEPIAPVAEEEGGREAGRGLGKRSRGVRTRKEL